MTMAMAMAADDDNNKSMVTARQAQ